MLVWILGAEAASSAAPGALALGKGAIVGALFVSIAFLAGLAFLRRSASSMCALLMVAAAALLEIQWLGLAPALTAGPMQLFEALFAASALIFVSASIGLAARNHLIGGLLFAGALSLIGIGAINALLGAETAPLLRVAVALAAGSVFALGAAAAWRGDVGARLILPGAALVVGAVFLNGGPATAPAALASEAVFAVGVLTASLVAFAGVDGLRGRAPAATEIGAAFAPTRSEFDSPHAARSRAEALRVSENQLAEVLDYAGIAVWDWSRGASHQTSSFAALMGADGDGAFTPEAFRAFVHADDVARFDQKVATATAGDGGFDEQLKLLDGRTVRLRGARAVDGGRLERLVVFLETVGSAPAAKSAAAAPPKEAKAPPSAPPSDLADVAAALDRGEIVAAFQPIVSFEDGRICGVEALLRWPEGPAVAGKPLETEEIVRRAQAAGKGGALAAVMMSATAKHVAERIAGGDSGFFGAFNVSMAQIREGAFLEDVRRTIADHALPKGALVLELTEAERLADTPKIGETFKKLKNAGAALAYDDFGAGFSSLSNLHKFDFDYLKIDKSFIDDIVANGGKKKIVAALARLGRDFDMTVIAEGVESKEAADVARTIGCRMGQGFYLGAPAINGAAPAANGADSLEAEVTITKGADELVLDRSLEAAPRGRSSFRRRLLGRA
jgi:EAL domain-containing protein (putative c-di-GMP-specific phosphodiesterase class I)